MKYGKSELLEDFRKIVTTCISAIIVATLIYRFGPDGTHVKHDSESKETTVKNSSWLSLEDTYQVISRDSGQPVVTVDNKNFAKVIPATPNSVYVQLNVPRANSLSFAADRPYDLIKVGGPINVVDADTATVAPPWYQASMKMQNLPTEQSKVTDKA